jgi:protein TonB
MNRYKLIATVASIVIYFGTLITVAYYFGYRSETKKPIVHFVEKNQTAIEVNIASPEAKPAPAVRAVPRPTQLKDKKRVVKKSHPKPKPKPKPKRVKREKIKPRNHKKAEATPKPKPKPKEHTKPKKEPPKKSLPKKEKPAPKPPKIPRKVVDTKKLFSSIKKNRDSATSSAKDGDKTSKSSSKSMKKESQKRGISDKYLAKVEKKLRGWPAQVNFVGEEIDVILKIYPSGNFTYRVKRLSKNREFNRELFAYLRQLQKFGFGAHNGDRAYEIEVKFVAKE